MPTEPRHPHHHLTSHVLNIRLPTWLTQMLLACEGIYPDVEARMQLAMQLARNNIDHASGGPFGAAIFDMQTHRLIAAGVNVVVSSHCSMAHAEMMAISMAQQQLASFDLAASGLELVSSCEPCAMCFGAIPWSGIKHLVCGARDEDARAIGFDEGPKMPDWQQALEQRGITVQSDICRQQGIDVLQHYARSGGAIYNPGDTL